MLRRTLSRRIGAIGAGLAAQARLYGAALAAGLVALGASRLLDAGHPLPRAAAVDAFQGPALDEALALFGHIGAWPSPFPAVPKKRASIPIFIAALF